MLDFRYHALSLVAVFLALAIGIVLGVTIGDSLLSDAERSLRSNLRANVVDARANERQAQSQLAARDRMLDQLYPSLVRDRLRGERVALVAWGPLDNGVENGVRDAIRKGGGRLDSVAVLDKPLSDLEEAVGPDRFALLGGDSHALQTLGSTLAEGLVAGDPIGRKLRQLFPDDFTGRFRHADAVAFFEAPPPTGDADAAGVKEREDSRAKAIETGMLDELTQRTVAVVGVEASGTDPSQIPRYESLKLSTVDSVDKSGGRIALVFALAGAQGNFGFDPTAKAPLPDEVANP
ncbi:MAG: copper transporter [Thermoleophilaceae bacterium]